MSLAAQEPGPARPPASAPAGLTEDIAILMLDRRRLIQRATRCAESLLGRPIRELLGCPFEEVLPPAPFGFTVHETAVFGRTRSPQGTLVTLIPALQGGAQGPDWIAAWAESAELATARDLEGHLLGVNQAFARKFGVPAPEWEGRDPGELVHPDDRLAWQEAEGRLRRPPHRAVREIRMETAQGWRWLSWEESPLRTPSGDLVGFRSIGRDVTKRRLAEEHFSKLASAVEQSPHAIVMTTPDGRVQYVNPRYTERTGYTLEDIFEKRIPVLREGHASEESYLAFQETVATGRRWTGELSTRTKDGRTFWEFVLVSPIRNHDDEITHLLCLREDITERKRLEEQLRQAQKMESLGNLAGGIAHDFNNVLAIINGFAEIAINRAQPEDPNVKYMREIHNAAQRAIGLVKQILTFSRKTEVAVKPTAVNQIVHDLGRMFSVTFPKTVQFVFDLDTQLPPVMGDPNQLQQVVLNLCVNARDAMPQGGNLTLQTEVVHGSTLERLQADPARRYIHIRVSDTGIGMPPHVKARIFEPFFTTKQASGGTGLGLAVVYGIILSHKGLLDVDSIPGEGTTFHVYLPVDPAAAGAAAKTVQALGDFPGGKGENVLIIEDETSLRDLIKSVLTQKGYAVTTANDGEVAVQVLLGGGRTIEAILLDLDLPKLHGIDVYKIIRRTHPEARTIVVSGNLSADARRELSSLGVKEFLNKPYTLIDLGQNLRRVLDAKP